MKSLTGASSALFGLLFLLAAPLSSASDSSSGEKFSPCVARSPTSGLSYDLNAISLSPPSAEGGKSSKNAREESWRAKGHDYNANFTLNICAPVVENLTDVVGIDRELWGNVSAYYEQSGKIFSLGQQASAPFFRGRKLVLNYTDGSPCSSDSGGNGTNKTKSTLMSFLCDRDAGPSQATASFVGTMDECAYFFEIRTSAACGGIVMSDNQGLGPGGVFGVIALIAVAAYLVGGCAYQRTVMHQRGWRQCPNYSLWAGTFDFVKDMIIILFSSLGRLCRGNRAPALGHSRGGSTNGGSFIGAIGGRRPPRASDMDAENRLIDQLDEEWDD